MVPARAKVLVVDDEESIRSVLREALTDAGHHVLTAENGQQALGRAVSERRKGHALVTCPPRIRSRGA